VSICAFSKRNVSDTMRNASTCMWMIATFVWCFVQHTCGSLCNMSIRILLWTCCLLVLGLDWLSYSTSLLICWFCVSTHTHVTKLLSITKRIHADSDIRLQTHGHFTVHAYVMYFCTHEQKMYKPTKTFISQLIDHVRPPIMLCSWAHLLMKKTKMITRNLHVYRQA
jgi:hypothetical protein